MRAFLVAGVILACAPASAIAQADWGVISLPGGVTAARRVLSLGDDLGRSDERFLLDLISLIYGAGPGAAPLAERLQHYVSHVQALQQALDGNRVGLQLETGPQSDRQRDEIKPLLDLLGLHLRESRGRWAVELKRGDEEVLRSSWLEAVGIDRGVVARQLNAGERLTLKVQTAQLPLPVRALWDASVLSPNNGEVPIIRIILDRRSALKYAALMGLDADTQAFAAGRREEWARFSESEFATLAAFGSSFGVKVGSVLTPGGPDAAPIWEALVDEKVTQPMRFLRALLQKRSGRLAFFYDAIAHLDSRRQRWVLAASKSSRDRLRTVERIADLFTAVEPSWDVAVRPFHRPAIDPELALRLLEVADDGTVGPAWWTQVFETITDDPDGVEPRAHLSRPTSAATLEWALNWIFNRPDDQQHRLRMFRFAQRQFATTLASSAADVETALRGFDRMPALLLALERMHVVAPSVLATAVATAHRLTRDGDPEQVVPLIRQWQGALAVLEQVLRRRSIPQAQLDGLLIGLAQVVPGSRTGADVTDWWFGSALPALGVAPAEAADEATWLPIALSGDQRDPSAVQWEGLKYRLDWTGPAARDALTIRRHSRRLTFNVLAALADLRRDAAHPALEGVAPLATRALSLAKTLATITVADGRPLDAARELDKAGKALAKVRRPKDLARVARAIPAIQSAIDFAAADVFPALAYALAVVPTPQPQVFADIETRHDFGVIVNGDGTEDAQAWRRVAWDFPVLQSASGRGASVRGALLSLDVPLADALLRPVAGGNVGATSPAFNRADRAAFASRLALSPTAGGDSDPGLGGVVNALRQSKMRVTSWSNGTTPPPEMREDLLNAGLSTTRINTILWAWMHRGPEAAIASLTPADWYRLGTSHELPPVLGLPALAFDGCLCLRSPERVPIERFTGRGDSGQLVTALPNLTIQVAEALGELGLPLALLEAILPPAMQDTFDHTAQFAPNDWEALAGPRLPKARVEEYLLALVAAEILAQPLETPIADHRR